MRSAARSRSCFSPGYGASHDRMEQIRAHVSQLCRGWPADRVREIVARHLDELIVPYVYDEARALLDAHRAAGEDVIIVSTSGHEMVGPIGALLGAALVIATQMEIAEGRYTGQIEFYAYGPAKAERVRELAARTRLPAGRLFRLQRLDHRPADAGGGGPPARGEPGPRPAPAGPAPWLARARLQRASPQPGLPLRPGRAPPAREVPPRNGTRGNDRDEESVRPRASPARPIRRRKVPRTNVLARQPGTHATGARRRRPRRERGRIRHPRQTRGPRHRPAYEAQLGSPVCRARLTAPAAWICPSACPTWHLPGPGPIRETPSPGPFGRPRRKVGKAARRDPVVIP